MSDSFRLLVVANKTCPCPGLPEEIERHVGGRAADVLVVAPALNSRLGHLTNDDRRALVEAEERLQAAVDLLHEAGIKGRGEVGDADPLNAVADAHATFTPDIVLISTWPEGSSHWLERDLIDRAREKLDVPVEHFISRYGVEAAAAQVVQ